MSKFSVQITRQDSDSYTAAAHHSQTRKLEYQWNGDRSALRTLVDDLEHDSQIPTYRQFQRVDAFLANSGNYPVTRLIDGEDLIRAGFYRITD